MCYAFNKIRRLAGLAVLMLLIGAAVAVPQSRGGRDRTFDLDHGDAGQEVIGPAVGYWIHQNVSPGFNDVSMVFRYFHLLVNAMYDAVAPYHPTAVGIYSRLGRRPAEETATNRNVNVALVYAVYRAMLAMAPQDADWWRGMVARAGLDPDDDGRDPATPVGIGNLAGAAVVEARRDDGFNQFGDAGGRRYHLQPFADTTGYRPVNTAFELTDAGRWQPGVLRSRAGNYRVQRFVTPQNANVEPYAPFDPRDYRLAAPADSDPANAAAYRAQVDVVLAASANLTDEQKVMAEFFDNKVRDAISPPPVKRKAGPMEFIFVDFVASMAGFDALVVTWQEKRRYDAVRPFSAIRHVYGDEPVTAWGGPGQGTVRIPASRWQSYIPLADHPEYPSASACVCEAQAQALRRYTGKDDTDGWEVFVPAGASRIEPGITPAQDLTFSIDTWTDFSRLCGQSRVWGGTHFPFAVDEAIRECSVFGDLAYEYFRTLLDGTAPPRGASRELPADPRRDDRSGK